MSADSGPAAPAQADQSVPDLVRQLSDQSTQLLRAEIELAKAELAQKGKQAGIGAGMFGGAGVFGLYGLGALFAAIIALLDTAMATWVAALIVAVVLLSIAGIAALMGKNRVQAAGPPVPEAAIETTKADVDLTKARIKEARNS